MINFLKSGIVLSAIAIVSCKSTEPTRLSNEASRRNTSSKEEKEILNCQVRIGQVWWLSGPDEVWDLSIKINTRSVKISYSSQGQEKSEVGIVYERVPSTDSDVLADSLIVFKVIGKAEFLGAGGPRIKRTDKNGVEYISTIGEYFNSQGPGFIVLRAQKDEQGQATMAWVDYGTAYKRNSRVIEAAPYSLCLPDTIKTFGW
jgi:hypothetical protein